MFRTNFLVYGISGALSWHFGGMFGHVLVQQDKMNADHKRGRHNRCSSQMFPLLNNAMSSVVQLSWKIQWPAGSTQYLGEVSNVTSLLLNYFVGVPHSCFMRLLPICPYNFRYSVPLHPIRLTVNLIVCTFSVLKLLWKYNVNVCRCVSLCTA